MTIRACASYTLTHATGEREHVEVEVATDCAYRPDVADDVAARVRATYREVVRDIWPVEVSDA